MPEKKGTEAGLAAELKAAEERKGLAPTTVREETTLLKKLKGGK